MVYEPRPVKCQPEAFDLFADQVRVIDAPTALLRAAVAISMHELVQASPAVVERQIQDWAEAIRKRVHQPDVRALLAHAHDVLFEELGFIGNRADYYDPLNSYLPVVMETRRGIPITLTLIYMEVLHRLGVRAFGVNAPGHFLAAVDDLDTGEYVYIDPFDAGHMLTRPEVVDRIAQTMGRSYAGRAESLHIATRPQLLARMLLNLRLIFQKADRPDDAEAMNELAALLAPGEDEDEDADNSDPSGA